jgi:amidohydrolase
MKLDKDICDYIQGLEDDVITWRRHFHKYPELSFKEFETTKYITDLLESLAVFDISHPQETATIATFDSGKPGRVIAIRMDIDALPIQENNDLEFKSVHDGVMHACGHDGHTAILLGVAHALAKFPDKFVGKIILIFQHAEEQPPGGAIEIYNAGVMEGVDELYGLHLSSAFDKGVFGIRAGVLTAATDEFRITVKGSGGHSAFPQLCIDPVVIGGEIITAIQTIIARKIAPSEEAVVSVCKVNAGTAYNVIPNTMQIIGSIRTFSEDTRQTIKAELEKLSAGIAQAHGGEADFEYIYGYDSVINEPELALVSEKAVSELFGEETVLHIDKVYPGEDFSALHKDCPAIFVEVGTADKTKGTHYPHHNPQYMMDEDMLVPCVAYFLQMIWLRMRPDGK